MALLKLCPDAKRLGLTARNVCYLDNNCDIAKQLSGGGLEICDHRLSVPDSPRKVSGTGGRPAGTGGSERNQLRQKRVETRNLGNKREFM